VNKADRAKYRAKMQFKIEEIQNDFEYFESKIIPELEDHVLTLIGQYLSLHPEYGYE
jgi:hypothetical protein